MLETITIVALVAVGSLLVLPAVLLASRESTVSNTTNNAPAGRLLASLNESKPDRRPSDRPPSDRQCRDAVQ